MKNLNLGQIIQIAANVGVLGGILLLAYELNQNNQFSEEQAEYASLLESLRTNELVIQNDISRLYYRSVIDEPLSALDQQRRSTLIGGMFEQWQWIFERRPDEIPTEALRGSWRRSQAQDVWRERKGEYSPNFVQFIEENVVNQ